MFSHQLEMPLIKVIISLCFTIILKSTCASDVFTNELGFQFPKNFIFGVSSVSHAADETSNGAESRRSSVPHLTGVKHERTLYQSNGHVCDRHNYRDDIKNIKDIGFSMYRFSISWKSVLPNGTVNMKELEYIKNLVDGLVANNITPMVILHEGDMPKNLLDTGGWLNPLTIRHFQEYSRLMFQHLGYKVKWWITIHEPSEIARGYGSSEKPPGIDLHGYGEYLAGHNLLRAHANVYKMYKENFYLLQEGNLSIGLKGDFIFPLSDSEEDLRTAETAMQFTVGWFGHPVYNAAGNYPAVMRDYIDRNSAIEGLKQSRLPYFSREDVQQIRGTFDFLAVSHQTSSAVLRSVNGLRPSWQRDSSVIQTFKDEWHFGGCGDLKVVPEGMLGILYWLKEEYGNVKVFIIENGYCDDGRLDDKERISYFNGYLKNLLKAIEEGCNIIGYCVRSLLDDFINRNNSRNKYGIYQLNATDTSCSKKKKLSAEYWKGLLQMNKISI